MKDGRASGPGTEAGTAAASPPGTGAYTGGFGGAEGRPDANAGFPVGSGMTALSWLAEEMRAAGLLAGQAPELFD
jgi:hypothetical protein